MRLSRALKEKQLDVRLRDKLIEQGKVKKEDIDKYLAELVDDQDNLIVVESNENKDQNSDNQESQPYEGQ